MFALIDANNFYVSCERVFQPKLNNKPVIVLSNNDGCAIARSNEAKIIGIKMGAPLHMIKNMISEYDVQLRSANFTLYGDMSSRFMTIVKRESPNIEVYSIDESFIHIGDYAEVDRWSVELRETVLKELGLPTSIGVARTKVLAKLANSLAKKSGGSFTLRENDEKRVLASTPVCDVWGIGGQLSASLMGMGIFTAQQFIQADSNLIRDTFSVVVARIQSELQGNSVLELEENKPIRKEILVSRSFGEPVITQQQINLAVSKFIEDGSRKLRGQESEARLLTVFLKTNRFSKSAKQYSNVIQVKLPYSTSDTETLSHYAQILVERIYRNGYEYKKAGIRLSSLTDANSYQNDLFSNRSSGKIDTVKDSINIRFGRTTLKSAVLVSKNQSWKMKRNFLSQSYTTNWNQLPVAI